jgi:hypothetical protein
MDEILTWVNVILVIIALSTLALVIRQTRLMRRTLYGEIYEVPPLERVGFLKPEPKYKNKQDKRVRFDEDKKVEKDNYIFSEVTLPTNSLVPLIITWRTSKKQSLRHLRLGFKPRHNKRPRIVKRLLGWVAKEIKPLQVGEYIDLDGFYHIEYPIPRKFGKGSPFITEFEIKTREKGVYDFVIEVYSEEAKESFEKVLKVVVE